MVELPNEGETKSLWREGGGGVLAWRLVMRLGGRERRETANSTFAPLATAMVTTLGSKSRTKTIRFLSALAYASRLLARFLLELLQRSGSWVASRGTVQEDDKRQQPG